MTLSEIITRFELQADDTTELSTTEETSIANRVYQKICSDLPWEFLKKGYSGTTDGTTTLALPSDFEYLTENYNYTESTVASRRPVVFVDNDPWEVVSWSDRKQYEDSSVAYVDIANSNMVFSKAPTSGKTVSYDYKSTPTDLTTSDSPVFPARFHELLVFGMMVEDSIIQQSDKAKSYAGENQRKYDSMIADMKYWNANLIQM